MSATVNVRDFGAVPGTDCSDAFQRAVDSLDPALGGTVLIPADPAPYEFKRSVIVDRHNVRFTGDGISATVLQGRAFTPPLVFGVARAPAGRAVSEEHWADLFGLLDTRAAPGPGTRWGCRTRVPADVAAGPLNGATVTFACSPFQWGPRDGAFWRGVRQLTLDFVVRNDAMPWQGQPLFGMTDSYNHPSPFFAQAEVSANAASVLFVFRTADGLDREIRLPFDRTEPVLRCSLQIDLDAATVTGWTGNVQVTPDLTMINDGWGDRETSFVPNWYAPFNLGQVSVLSSGWGGGYGLPGGPVTPVDLTFGALRFSDVARYRDLGAGSPQQDDHGPVSDLTFLTDEPGVFCVLPMDQPVRKSPEGLPDLQVRWLTGGVPGYGLFMPVGPMDTYDSNAVERLTVFAQSARGPQGFDYGQGIGLGQVVGFSMADARLWFGAQGLSSYHLGANYPVEVKSSEFRYHTDSAIYSFFQTGWGDNLKLAYYGRSAFKAFRANVSYRNVILSGVEVAESVVRLIQCGATVLDNWSFDFEGRGPSDSYVYASLADDVGGTQLVIRDTVGVNGDSRTAAVRLDSHERAAGLTDTSRGTGWCKIERSFNTFLSTDMQAVVAVDGPVWRGLFEGVPKKGVPLVVNTATPGASARIGTDSVPPPRSVPPLVARGADDPVLALDGLIGYYRADASPKRTDTRPIVDGTPVPLLADLSPAHNDGTAVGNAAVYETAAVNGLPALRFTGGWYEFPALRGTTGAATVFLAGKRLPTFDTAPGLLGSLRTSSTSWLLGQTLRVLSPESDTEWAVYAVRCTAGPRRVLQSYANGHLYDLRRYDPLAPVTWDKPTLGTGIGHLEIFQGLLGTAIICDAALPDPTVSAICRHLLNLYDIAV